jgi:hypothetical protein
MSTNRLKLASAVLTIGSCILWERITNMRPSRPPAIPPSFGSLTPAWLTAALCAAHPGAQVDAFSLEGGSVGTTSRTLINLRYNARGRDAGLPEQVFAKATPRLGSRLSAGLAQAMQKEAIFFNTLRPELDLEAPRAYFGGYELPSQRSMILFEVMKDHVFTNPTVYIDRREAEDMVGLLATLHGKFWSSERLRGDLAWVIKSYDMMVLLNQFGFEPRCHVGMDRAADVIPAALRARRPEIYPATMTSLKLNNQGAQTLLHHDVHIGNWYKTPQGRMGLGDWQCLAIGNFACDLAYALGSALTIDDRRAWERDLLNLYLERLKEAGVADVPASDAAWIGYRQQFFHGFVFWLYTIGAGALQPNMQPDAFSLLNIERFANAMVDLDSLGSLKLRA